MLPTSESKLAPYIYVTYEKVCKYYIYKPIN